MNHKHNLLFYFVLIVANIFAQENKDSIKTHKLKPIYLTSLSDFRKEKNAAIVLSTIKSKELKNSAANADIPEILMQTPSVYATKQGGGYGDSRINLRGFEQRNIAVTVNGMPVNDMETGWVYWSNWMDLKNIASSIQIQRGLSASRLVLPSVGGSINIYTRAGNKISRKQVSFNYGSEGFFKESIAFDTGIMSNDLAVSVMFSHYKGKGYVDMTAGEGFNYFLNLDYLLNDKNRILFTVFGGPQAHDQRNKAPELKDYISYSNNGKPDIKYNQEWGYLKGKTFTWSRNYFHKPVVSINWDYQLNDSWIFTSLLYGTWGKGGGTGPIGAINYNYPDSKLFLNKDGQVRFDDIYTWNSGGKVDDFGPDRIANNGLYINDINTGLTRFAFMNNHAWYGTIMNIQHKSPRIHWNAGIDLRITRAKNTLTVNNVLGADAYYDNFDINHPDRIIYPDGFVKAEPSWNPFKSIDNLEKIVFFNGTNIRWAGWYGQIFYENTLIRTFLQTSLSNQQYQRIDFFNLPPENQKSDWIKKWGGNIKAGFSYKIDPSKKIYINGGYFSKQPLFKAIFPKWNSNEANIKVPNEKIYSAETGLLFKNRNYKFLLNLYSTLWKDRMVIVNDLINNQQVSGNLYGVTEVHQGIEIENRIKLNSFAINGMVSIGNWHYQGNVNNVKLYNFQQQEVAVKNYYLNGIKVGNAPQFTANYKITYKINNKITISYNQFFVDKLYAAIDATNFSNPDNKGSLKLPAYSVSDINLSFQTKIRKKSKVKVNFIVKNLMDEHYISESKTNFFPEENTNTWKGINTKNRVFFGWGRTFNVNLSYEF